jgi:hypothetical protein
MQSSNRNDIARDIKSGLEDGRYKDCVNLCIGGDVGLGFRGFVTHCAELAFENSVAEGYVVTVGQNYCPTDCHFFKSRAEAESEQLRDRLEKNKKGRRQRRKQQFDSFCSIVVAPFKWFGRLPWQTQFLIILLAILLFSPKWGPVIIQVIKAIK